jgi:hypothetical protein
MELLMSAPLHIDNFGPQLRLLGLEDLKDEERDEKWVSGFTRIQLFRDIARALFQAGYLIMKLGEEQLSYGVDGRQFQVSTPTGREPDGDFSEVWVEVTPEGVDWASRFDREREHDLRKESQGT